MTLTQEAAEARARGAKIFRQGEVCCGKGHTEGRHTSSARCVTCARERSAAFYKANPEKAKADAKRWQHANPEKVAASKRKEQKADPAKFSARQRAWCAANPEKSKAGEARRRARRKGRAAEHRKRMRQENPEAARAVDARWAKKYPEKAAAKTAIRRARKKSQVCECCTKSDFVQMYDAARREGGEVDHILPLAAGGKHCRLNLQILSVDEHKAKTSRDVHIIAAYKKAQCDNV